MDKKGDIKEHSREKLFVYGEYLKASLSVITNTNYFSSIAIWDIFAGNGKGSPSIAIKIIKNLKTNKEIRLYLNDVDKNSYEKLKNLINKEKAEQFTKAYNHNAELLIDRITKYIRQFTNKQYNLFFIDPWGYTQYSQENLRQLFSISNSEYFIFIPINNIYRFKEGKPARQFLLDLGINESLIKDERNIQDLRADIKNIFEKKANTQFVSDFVLENSKNKNKYLLLFITKHILGLEKFLKSKEAIKEQLKKQQLLWNLKENELTEFLNNLLKTEKTNIEIYEESLIAGFLPTEVNSTLREWKKEDKLQIEIIHGRKGAFYLNYENYKKKETKIKIKLK